MGTVPGWLLRHRITIAPYLGTWGSYGTPEPGVRCFVDRKLRSAVTSAGVVRYSVCTIVARPGTRCPEGSIITLADGARGYAEAIAAQDSGGLPGVPDHLQIAVTIGSGGFGAPLGGELVMVVRRTANGTDRYRNTLYATSEHPVEGASVRPLTSDEKGGLTYDAVEVVVPPGTVVGRVDRLRVRGLLYEVDGAPEDQHDPMTGVAAGVRIVGRRVTS